jgi:tyrosine-protein phosphatase YwqE
MFFFRKKEKNATDLSWLHTDMHSHLVPDIDDGSPDMATSLELIRGFKNLGYQKIVTTPHILWDIYANTAETITAGIKEVKKTIVEAGVEIEMEAAAEYFIDDHFKELLDNKTPLLPISGNIILVEFSMLTAPIDLQDILFEMQMQGYVPVIAHPERYIYLSRKKEFFEELKSSGCLLQLNLLSLAGHYGSSVQELAEWIAKKDLYDYAGTDVHNHRHLAALEKLGSSSWLKRLKESGTIKNHLL